jgi:uncharacterized membrane protein
MERMLVVVFDDDTKAYQGKSALRQLELEGSIAIHAGAVVAKNADGATTVKQYDDVEPVGTLVGTSVGGLIGLLGGPIGVAIGAVSGLTVGALSDYGSARVGEDFVEEVSKTLTPSKVALIAEVEEGWTTPVDTRMETLGGTVIRRALSDVREQLRAEEIAAMKADVRQLKEELASAKAERRAKLQEKVNRLEQQVDEQQKKAQAWLEAFQKRQQAKRELVKKNATNMAHAIKTFAKTPPF